MARLDELEARDPRFARNPDGSMSETFPDSGSYTPTERASARERFIKGLRTDITRWRDAGDEVAAQRGEIQISFQRAEWDSTHHSRRATEAELAMLRNARDKLPDAAQQQRQSMDAANERMLESDRNSSLANRKLDELHEQYQSDTFLKQLDERKRVEEVSRREVEEQQQAAAQEARDRLPLREQLTDREQEHYDKLRTNYDRAMERFVPVESRVVGQSYTEQPGQLERFDRMYREDMQNRASKAAAWDAAESRAAALQRETATAGARTESSSSWRSSTQDKQADGVDGRPVQRPSGMEEPIREKRVDTQGTNQSGAYGVKPQDAQAEPAEEAAASRPAEPELQAADTRREHAPLLRQYEGYKAEVADEGKSIGYRREEDGKMGFKDLGNRVAFSKDPAERSVEDIRTALRHSEGKFGETGFTIRGPKEFQEQAAREAARMGMGDRVRNQELKSVIDDERAKVAQEQAAKAIGDAKTGSSTGQQAKTDDASAAYTAQARGERSKDGAGNDMRQRDSARRTESSGDAKAQEKAAERGEAQSRPQAKPARAEDDQDGSSDAKGSSNVEAEGQGRGDMVESRYDADDSKASAKPHDRPEAEKGRADERGDLQHQAEGDRPDASDRQASSSSNMSATAKAKAPDYVSDSSADSDSARATTRAARRTPDSAAPRSKGSIQKPVFYDEVKGRGTSDSGAAKQESAKSSGSSYRPRAR